METAENPRGSFNKLVEGKGPQLACSAWGCFLIPIDALGGMFFGFSFTSNENQLIWRFIQFADLWQIPAILISFFFPRIAAFLLIANILISFAIGYHIEHCGCVLSSGISHWTVAAAIGSVSGIARLYGAEFVLALALLWTTRSSWGKHNDGLEEEEDSRT